jgi:hypothetical protein
MKKLGWKVVILLAVEREDGEEVLIYKGVAFRKIFKHQKKYWAEVDGLLQHVERHPDWRNELAIVDRSRFGAERRIEELTAALCEREQEVIARLANEPLQGEAMKSYLEARGWSLVNFAEVPPLYIFANENYPGRQLYFPRDTKAVDFQEALERIVEKLAQLEKREILSIRSDLYARRKV